MKTASLPNAISSRTNTLLHVLFLLFAALCVLPLLLVLSVSLSTETQVLLEGYRLLPRGFTLHAYRFILRDSSVVARAYLTTILVTLTGTTLSVLIIALFAYPLSRPDLRYRNAFTFYIFITMLFTGGLVPWYIVCSQVLRITNSYLGLFVPYLFNAWYVIVMRTFYKTTLPDSIIESAKIDGAGEWRIFFQIVSPLSKPGYATIGLFCTLALWNDWWLPMILMTDSTYHTLQYMIYKVLTEASILRQMATAVGGVMTERVQAMPLETARFAMCIVALGPIVLAYPFFQKHFVKGLTIGAVKG